MGNSARLTVRTYNNIISSRIPGLNREPPHGCSIRVEPGLSSQYLLAMKEIMLPNLLLAVEVRISSCTR